MGGPLTIEALLTSLCSSRLELMCYDLHKIFIHPTLLESKTTRGMDNVYEEINRSSSCLNL